jgi:hypothetical protein
MDEHQIEEIKEIRDCLIAKFPITNFGKGNEKITSLYPDTKFLAFCTEPWKIIGAHV